MPNRARSGDVSSPARVVAPTSVKRGSGHLDGARAGPLPDHDVELVIFHRGIEDLLDRGAHPVDLVDEEHLPLLQVGEHRRKVAWLLDDGAGGGAHRHAELVPDDVGERRLAEPGRAVQQHVIERLAALTGRGDRDLQVLADAILADVVVQRARTKARFVLRILVRAGRCDNARVGHELLFTSRFNASLSAGSNAFSPASSAAPTAFSAATC